MFAVDDIDEKLDRLCKRGALLKGFSSESPKNAADCNAKAVMTSDQGIVAYSAMEPDWSSEVGKATRIPGSRPQSMVAVRIVYRYRSGFRRRTHVR
jgi:hypothetical protein